MKKTIVIQGTATKTRNTATVAVLRNPSGPCRHRVERDRTKYSRTVKHIHRTSE